MRTPTPRRRRAPRFGALPLLALSLIVASALISSGCSTVPVAQPQVQEADLPTIPAVLLLPADRTIPALEPSSPDGSASELEVIIAETDCRLAIDNTADQLDALIIAVQGYVAAVLNREARRNAPPPKRAWTWPWQ